jgi:hypothetical protein
VEDLKGGGRSEDVDVDRSIRLKYILKRQGRESDDCNEVVRNRGTWRIVTSTAKELPVS